MPVLNNDIAQKLNETADLLEVQGENIFRIRAYRSAARTVESLSRNVSELISEGQDLSKYPGIGKDLEGKIRQIVESGTFGLLDDLKNELPEDLTRLMQIPGLGAKRVGKIYRELNVSNIEGLKQVIDEGRLRELEGFGKKTEQNILDEIKRLGKDQAKRFKLPVAEQIAESLVKYLKSAEGVKSIDVAGSLRRRKETVKDLDILVACKRGSNIMEHFTNFEDVKKVVSKGKTRSTVILKSNINVDLRAVQQVSYGSALLYFTGSKEHNVALRKIGIEKKFKLNEYGVFKGDERVAGKTEADVYKKLGLPFIEPEIRENRGELEAGRKGKLPKLISMEDIKGDLHTHTNYTDGRYSIKDMAEAAQSLCYDYIAVTDHSKHLTVAGGLKPEEVRKQIEEIERVNEELKDITILKGTELDILEDGSLDLPDEILKELDIRVCSVHYKFNLPKAKQTERILRAMDNPYFNILAHPTGRVINERPPYEIDIEKILKAAKDRGCIIELNSHPQRLDLNDIHCKMAKEIGVKIVISTDSHHTEHLKNMRFGIGQARRGWLEPEDVVNTKSLTQLKKMLTRK